jgi:hypothetical protein
MSSTEKTNIGFGIKGDDIDVPYDLSEDLPELLFNNVWKIVEDLFPETDEEPPARPGGIRIEV